MMIVSAFLIKVSCWSELRYAAAVLKDMAAQDETF
jgi:hypothetical protein